MIQQKTITLENMSSVEEALNKASELWRIPVEELHSEVISEEKSGFLGLGAKKFTVKVTGPDDPDLTTKGVAFLDEVLRLMDFEASTKQDENDRNMIEVEGKDASDYVVGRYGDALKAMEYLVNLALRDPKKEPRLKVDSCGYRARRAKSLERLAEATARQAIKFGRPIKLEPMESWERWVIHTTLKGNPAVSTESVGESPSRKVVVMPNFEANVESEFTPGPAMMRVRAMKERSNVRNSRNQSGRRKFRR
ncbi:MAG: Jag N-terminal domain-containing protein [Synergistaceae bacterium]|nr:Jag N-terminal domain-containing protein [Synergistaceae bacterium]